MAVGVTKDARESIPIDGQVRFEQTINGIMREMKERILLRPPRCTTANER